MQWYDKAVPETSALDCGFVSDRPMPSPLRKAVPLQYVQLFCLFRSDAVLWKSEL